MFIQIASMLTTGAILELSGPDSMIEMGGATLQASCPDLAATPSFLVEVNDLKFGQPGQDDNLVVPLLGVATSCVGISLGKPCVELSKLAPRPPMFECALTVDGKAIPLNGGKKIHATLNEVRTSMGELLEVEPVLSCPLSDQTVQTLGATSGSLSLSLTFFDGVESRPMLVGGGPAPAIDFVVYAPPPSGPPPPPPPPPPGKVYAGCKWGKDAGGTVVTNQWELRKYNTGTNEWTALTAHPNTEAYKGMGLLNGIIYTVGGQTNRKKVFAYDMAAGTWSAKADTLHNRYAPAVGILGDYMYAAGLGDRNSPQDGLPGDSIERYDPTLDEWKFACHAGARKIHLAQGVTHKGKFYIMGGMESHNLEMWDPAGSCPTADVPSSNGVPTAELGGWTTLAKVKFFGGHGASVNNQMWSPNIIMMDDFMYLLGYAGYGSNSIPGRWPNNAIRMDLGTVATSCSCAAGGQVGTSCTDSSCWEDVPSMDLPSPGDGREGSGVALVDGQIFHFAGRSSAAGTTSTYVADNMWVWDGSTWDTTRTLPGGATNCAATIVAP